MTKEQSAQHKDNWSAAGMVGMFDAVHRQRDQARYRRGVVLWCLTIALCLGLPLWITWGKFQDARRQTLLEKFASRRPVAQQRTTTNPASEEALRQADELRTAAQSKNVAESIVDLRRALQLLADAQDIDRDVKRLRDLLNPVGTTLTETPWHTESDVIDQQQKALGQRHKAIVALLEVGNTQQAEKDLATLLADVGQLQRGNVEAMKTDTARQTWLRQKSHIPARLTDAPSLAAILRRGKEGEDGRNSGDWTTARLSYSGAVEDLERVLQAELTGEEKATLLESDADSLARLETERADLAQQIDSLKQQINDPGTQLATTNGERQAALAKAAELTKERDRLSRSATTTDTELKELRPLKVQLADTNKSQQSKLALPHTRHAGKSAPSASELIGLCRGQVEELVAERRKAEFACRRADGKLPSAADIEVVPISPGKFQMGSTEYDNEKPVREKTISKPFYAGKYEVTIGQILTWLNSPGVTLNDEWIDLSNSDCPIRKSGGKFELNTSTGFGKSVDQPMVYVSWHGAKAFSDWCSKVDRAFTYRLPTEAEWEYMARAGTTTAYPWGDSCNGSEANVDGNNPFGTSTKGPYKQVTVPVGSYKPNVWGLCDPAGNVYEWCDDWYEKEYYASSPATDPQGPSSGSSRVLRGGSWFSSAIVARSSSRTSYTPVRRHFLVGFRLVAE